MGSRTQPPTRKSEEKGEATEETLPKVEETVETLSARLEEESEKVKEYLDQWKRSAAEFSNYRKRNEKERGELIKFTNALLITRLLPILDDLERAFQTLPDNMRHVTWTDGVALVHRKLEAILEQEGLKAIEEDKASVIVLGSTTMHQSHHYLQEKLPVPVINPGVVAYKLCELLLELGLSHSKLAYPDPETLQDENLFPNSDS